LTHDVGFSKMAQMNCNGNEGAGVDLSKRSFLQAIASSLVASLVPGGPQASSAATCNRPNRRLIVVVPGGVRRQETFSETGKKNIPHLYQDMLPSAVFYSSVRNEGVTSHFNSISSIVTGNWQRVDDWGLQPPTTPTLFEYARKQLRLDAGEVWLISSNKVVTDRIGASSATAYGPSYRANVVFPKQLLIAAVEEAIRQGRQQNMVDRAKVQEEIEAVLLGSNYEGLGWNITGERQGGEALAPVESAIQQFVHSNAPTTGDQLTYYVTIEIMRKYAPSILFVNFSDIEAAHFGSYSLHLAGIRNTDRLIYELWQQAQANPEYRGNTLMVILPEFGRDPDGSNTNGFLNHRSNDDTCRRVWMMCLGQPFLSRSQVIDRPVRQVDVCPSLALWMGCRATESAGGTLAELRA
jgi:hypothetical protein